MSSNLFFSILIPTKNRSHLVGDAIHSVLNQSFKDFEIIVIDNDDSNNTKACIDEISDHRIRYYRTGGLSMVENWEFGRQKTKGQFITVLEDKQVYYSWTLEWLYNTIKKHGIEIITWNWDILKTQRPPPPEDRCKISKTTDILEQYVTAQHPWKKLPRLINSCVSQKIIESICKQTPNNSFFVYYSPDLCAAFMQLATVDEILTTNCRLGYLNSSESNAVLVAKEKKNGTSYFSGKTVFDINNTVNLVPIKNPYMPHNTIYNDFLNIRNKFPNELNPYKMSPIAYSKTCLRDLIFILKVRGEIKKEFWELVSYMRKNLNLLEQINVWYCFIQLWYQQKKLQN